MQTTPISIRMLLPLLLFLTACNGGSREEISDTARAEPSDTVLSESSVQKETFRLDTVNVTYADEDAGYTVAVDYPKVVGMPGAERINNDVKRLILDILNNALQSPTAPAPSDPDQAAELLAGEFAADAAADPRRGDPDAVPVSYSYEITFSVEERDSASLGFLFTIFTYTGGAHPNTSFAASNYALPSGKRWTLDDLFADSPDYLKKLSEQSRQVLRQRSYGDGVTGADFEEMLVPGTEPTPENFSTYILMKDSIRLIFNPYQVGPYVIGMQEVALPYTALR